MLRIGIAASKISKGSSLLSYNLCVIFIASLISLFVFLICGFSILLIIFLVSLVLHAVKPAGFHFGWAHTVKICLITLGFIVGFFNIAAIVKNIQLSKSKA